MSTKIINNLKVHGESTTQKYTDAQYNTDTQRINGAQPGTPISSKLMNTGLRNATLVTSALIEALKTVVPNDNDLTAAITVGTATTHAALVTALTEALVKIKVETAVLADNVKSGAIVEETTTARESKQGYGISLGINSKLQFKTTWLGTHKNNDVLYYSTAGTSKGFYIVKGLNAETTSQSAGTLIITSGQTPTTHAANLQRLTFETAISTNAGLSKTDIISSSSTTNQLATAKAIWDYAQAKLVKYTAAGVKILTRDVTDGVYYDLDKVTSVSSTSTDMQIPTAKCLYDDFQTKIAKHTTAGIKILSRATTDGALSDLDKVTIMPAEPTNSQIPTAKLLEEHVESYVENRKWTLVRDTTSWTTISNLYSNSTPTTIACNSAFTVGDVLAFELAISGYTDRPFIVQSVLTLDISNPNTGNIDTGNIFKAEGLTTYGQEYGEMNVYKEVRHYIKFGYSDGTNLMFKTVGVYGDIEIYPTARPLAIEYARDDYDDATKNVTSKTSTDHLQIRRIWRIR